MRNLNIDFKIVALNEYDRYLFIKKQNGIIIHIDFIQGIYLNEEDVINTFIYNNTNRELMSIYTRLMHNKRSWSENLLNLDEVNLVNYAVELYCVAYIHQYIEY